MSAPSASCRGPIAQRQVKRWRASRRLPERRRRPGAHGPRQLEDDRRAGVQRRSRNGSRRARFPSPPPLRGRGQRPAFLPAEGEGRPLAPTLALHRSDFGSCYSEQAAAPLPDPLPPRAKRAWGRGKGRRRRQHRCHPRPRAEDPSYSVNGRSGRRTSRRLAWSAGRSIAAPWGLGPSPRMTAVGRRECSVARGMAAGDHGSPLPRQFGGEGRGRRSRRPRVRGGGSLRANPTIRRHIIATAEPPLTPTLSPRARIALGGEGQVTGAATTQVSSSGLVPRTHRAVSVAEVISTRCAAVPVPLGKRSRHHGSSGQARG